MTQDDLALTAANYVPPASASGVSNDMAALIQAAVTAAIAKERADVLAASQPPVLSPEEAARAALDKSGVGLGVEERLQELYLLLELLARKVGI